MSAQTVLLTGAEGQLGRALRNSRPKSVELVALTRAQCDLQHPEQCVRAVEDVRPHVVLNAAAYTRVEDAESDAAAAFRVNADGPGALAGAAARIGARFVQLSTDFVFDGAQGRPYEPDARPNPLSVYGASKYAGEQRVLETTAGRAVVVRTAWLYASHGRNFVSTMLSLMAARDEVTVVSDQVGTPTWTRSLADALWAVVATPTLSGVLHWTDAGVASWYDFAVAIYEEARQRRLVERAVHVRPIASAEYPAKARRPSYSVLDNSTTAARLQMEPRHWRANLRSMMDELVR
jgi:dTDP-4-dehydrorhamnose reductase